MLSFIQRGCIYLIVTLARGISSKFIAIGVIKEEDRAIYDYSFQLLLSDILNVFALMILSVITGKLFETILYMITFMYLRSIGGGYHASSHFRCFLTMLFAYAVFLITLFILPQNFHIPITILSCTISAVVVFALAPVDHANKPLNTKEKFSLAKKSRLTVILFVIAIVSFQSLFQLTWPGLSVGLSMLSVSVSMIVAYYDTRKTKKTRVKE
jgi:accessory gene regulator B